MGKRRVARLKREDYKHTNHDSAFSPWKILIGPFDWKDYDLGKNGVERYRTHNLPKSNSSTGLYELGIVASCSDLDHGVRRVKPGHVTVVYLGEADNVRTRLQHYGRAGSHLDHGNFIRPSLESQSHCFQRGPGLFKDVFSRGFSIAYRWAQMDSKSTAKETEAQLLAIFDYAWNKGGNGTRRREDILLLLDKTISRPSRLFNILPEWKPHIFHGKKVGIKIDGCMPLEVSYEKAQLSSTDWLPKFIPSSFKYSKSRPLLAFRSFSINETNVTSKVILETGQSKESKNSVLDEFAATGICVCGVRLEDGSICLASPLHGRKRCEMHKGRRATSTILTPRLIKPKLRLRKTKSVGGQWPVEHCIEGGFISDGVTSSIEVKKEDGEHNGWSSLDEMQKFICGVYLKNGDICRIKPVGVGKRCSEHKGMRSCRSNKSVFADSLRMDYPICGVKLSNESACQNRPFEGRKRCSEHKGMRISGMMSGSVLPKEFATKEQGYACGVPLKDGSICMFSPVPGRKRCERHKGRRVSTN